MIKIMDSTLIILTKKWGINYTGATLATQYLTEKWEKFFDNIIVYTIEIGTYKNNLNIKIKQFDKIDQLFNALCEEKKNINGKILGYSDDHLGYLFKKSNIPYVHTYHGNWPDAKWVSLEFFVKSFYFIPLYRKTIRGASIVVNVSKYMERFTDKSNLNSVVIHNGMDYKPVDTDKFYPMTYVMVGNIDSRQYKKMIKIAKKILVIDKKIKIDIYGNIMDDVIARKLKKIENINLKGVKKVIPYTAYCGLINTSTIENLSISVCEAIQSGIPIFCFKVGGLEEVVKNNETGFIFEKNEYDKMAEKIVNYTNEEGQIQVDKKIVATFDWSVAAKKYLKLFEKIRNEI